MSGPRILFLPDFGASVGGGHVMRCLTLAGELMSRGAVCAFAVEADGARVIETFAPGTPVVDAGWAADIAVVDGYDYTTAQERVLVSRGLKVAAFDDILRPHDCDLIIDSGLGKTEGDYPGRARVLAGAEFSPVRPEFVALRDEVLPRRASGRGGRVLVSLGLTDVGGITSRVLRILSALPGWDAMDIVLGSGAASLSDARALAASDPRITLHVETRDMAALTAAADIAVGAGGGSQWERSVLGLPTLLLVLVPNQAATAVQLADLGAALVLDVAAADFDAAFTSAFARLATDRDLRRSISARAAQVFDGRGAARVAEAVMALVPA